MVTVITTFSEQGYDVYGKRWIASVIKNWPADTRVVIYTDFNLAIPADNFVIKQFDAEFPYHSKFKQLVINTFNKDDKAINIGHKTIKFSFKGFVICKELLIATGNYLVWLDGDVETLDSITHDDFVKQLNLNFLACQTEKQTHRYPHIESGILIFDCLHPVTNVFQKQFEEYYYTDKLFKLKKPYDGYIIGKVLTENKMLFTDFNKNISVIGKNSSKDLTFQHPFLKQRFVHWIGGYKA
jgi:hypothetical protein